LVGGGLSVASDGVPVCGGSEVLLLFDEEGQLGYSIGGKKEGVWWVHFVGDRVLRLVGRRGGGGDGGSNEGRISPERIGMK
jgi:hypothetical protein